MEAKKLFAVVGTDARQAAAGRVLERAGYAVGGAEQVALADYILLPLPLDASPHPAGRAAAGRKARRGGTGRQALSSGKDHRTGSGRGAGGLLCPTGADGVQCHPYGGRAALASCWPERTRTLWGTNLLLLGFGPVGQALGARLAALGANVTVCARRAGTACAGREPWSAGCRACPAGRAGSGL